MTTPVTGPFSRNVTIKGPPTSLGYKPDIFNKTWTWYRQKVPFDRPLAFTMDMRSVELFYDTRSGSNYRDVTSAPSYVSNDVSWRTSTNKAYAKFVDAIGEQSQWANNVYEMRHAGGVILDSATRLLAFSRAVRKLDARGAAKALGLDKRSVSLHKNNTFSQNWLRYHFGWEPLIKDIHAATDSFCYNFDPKQIKGRGQYLTKELGQSGDINSTSFYHRVTNRRTACLMRSEVRVTNPNLFLAKQLGLINPASIAWEAVPFSFVVDWFANVGQVLSAITDLYGVTLVNPDRKSVV